MLFAATNHILQLPASLGRLYCSANCYRPEGHECSSGRRCDGIVLIFAHCTSAHKEQWEPSIEKLFQLAHAHGDVDICEAWSLDCTSHGDSAVHNASRLSPDNPITVKDYGALLRYFSNSSFIAGRSKVVGIGHSSSTSAWTLACALDSLPRPSANLSALILVEPVMLPPPIANDDPRIQLGKRNVQGVLSRRDSWESLASTRVWLLKRYPYKTWDPRIIEIYLKHGFHTVTDPAGNANTTYKCKIAQEVAFYTHEDHVLAGEVTAAMCAALPVHCVFGERPELVSLASREMICDASQGRTMSSVSVIRGAGHLAVQEKPDGVAQAVYDILSQHRIPSRMSSLLNFTKAVL